jgi:hypothetical protein
LQLTEAQRARLQAKLQSLWKNHRCEVCFSESWSVSDRVYELRDYNQAMVVGRRRVPLIMANCDSCGHTRLTNAIAIGLISRVTGEMIDG